MIDQLSPIALLGIVAAYFLLLIVISWFTSRNADNADFFLAGRKSPWGLVAFGMIGASLSGVTFISIPGAVGAGGANMAFSYMQVVFGYTFGYAFIALVLLPLYYRMGLTSIYEYLEERLGYYSYKTGAFYFLVSRTIGSAFRLFIVAIVLQQFVLGPLGVSFFMTVAITIALIWVYTYKGGIKTIVYTDTLQTFCMLASVVITVLAIGDALETNLGGMVELVQQSAYSQIFFFEGGWTDPNNFFKQFFSGMLITIVMTGLDQDMMQKNLSMSNIRDAQKNMFSFSFVLVFVNLLFLFLGALLYIYAASVGLEVPARTDELYPMIALRHLTPVLGVMFIIGLVAAAYSSADSALTALTTSFCVDFLGFGKKGRSDNERQYIRRWVHVGFSIILLLVILVFNVINSDAVITSLFKAAGYTYGPLLGLFAFGLLTRLKVREVIEIGRLRIPALLLICLASPIISFLVDTYSAQLLYGFQFGFLLLAFNGLLTFIGLLALSYRDYEAEHNQQPLADEHQ